MTAYKAEGSGSSAVESCTGALWFEGFDSPTDPYNPQLFLPRFGDESGIHFFSSYVSKNTTIYSTYTYITVSTVHL